LRDDRGDQTDDRSAEHDRSTEEITQIVDGMTSERRVDGFHRT
jgi:hypothetical protein